LEENKQASFFTPAVQPKLSINPPNDMYEQEADAMADKVMRMPDTSIPGNLFFKPPIQRKCAACEEEEKQMQREEINSRRGCCSRANRKLYIFFKWKRKIVGSR
jgi:hypothetical protein